MDRYSSTKKAGVLGILGNFFLFIIKGFVGYISNSQALIADAANSAGDIFASLMTFIGNKIASEPDDKTHNFGHGKAEYIFSLFISISMIFVATKLLYDANMKDHRNDCIVTSFTLISILLSLINIYWFDGIVGIGISIWICYTGIKIFIESYNILMDISIDSNTEKMILDLAHSYKDIKKLDDISSTPVGYKYIIVLTIYVDGNMSTFNSHNLADSLEQDITKLDKIYKTIIHVNPI